ncbi:MAG: protein kinase, partial [Actinobacteria bacterium]|nr:protein kinase [Actinomycetota bacterium]
MTGETFRLRGYQIERLIGRGATSEVWLARVRATGERVALKRIGVVDEQQRARAHAEAELLGALDHPNLVRLLGLVAGRD